MVWFKSTSAITSFITVGCAKTYVRLSGTGRNLVRTCNPLTRLVHGTRTFLIRKNKETVENSLEITVE